MGKGGGGVTPTAVAAHERGRWRGERRCTAVLDKAASFGRGGSGSKTGPWVETGEGDGSCKGSGSEEEGELHRDCEHGE